MMNYRSIFLICLSLWFSSLQADELNKKTIFRNYQEAPSHVKEFYNKKIEEKIKFLSDFNTIPISKIKSISEIEDRETFVYDYASMMFIAIEKEIGMKKMWEWISAFFEWLTGSNEKQTIKLNKIKFNSQDLVNNVRKSNDKFQKMKTSGTLKENPPIEDTKKIIAQYNNVKTPSEAQPITQPVPVKVEEILDVK